MRYKSKKYFFTKFRALTLLLPAIFLLVFFPFQKECLGKIYIDIDSPSGQKFEIAIPDFTNLGDKAGSPGLAAGLREVIVNDLELSGYFNSMDRDSFLEDNAHPIAMKNIRFKNWSVIGADFLLKAGYVSIGRSLELEVRLFDVFSGRQILGKKILGGADRYRYMMHRIGDEIIRVLTGHKSIFLTKLAFVSNSSGHKEIYVCDYDGHNAKRITSDKSIALLPGWSPDGKRLLYNSYKDGGPKLYIKAIDSGAVKMLSGRSGLNTGASWAPDGKKIALTLSHKGDADIFLIGLNGMIKRRLTQHWGIDVSPTFSPDGRKIAFTSSRSGSPQIYVMDLTNGRQDRLTFQGKYNTSPSWSSLNRIAFTSMNNGVFDIFTMDVRGGRLRKLTGGSGNNEDPCWSPDGKYIVFSSNRHGNYDLYLMNANGQNQRKITSLKGEQTAPSWNH